MQCPSCKSRIIWKCFYPKNEKDYLCQTCGTSWDNDQLSFPGIYGSFIGPWQNDEMQEIEENLNLLAHSHPPVDWVFFKGNHIFATWKIDEPSQVIYSKSRAELNYWMSMAAKDSTGKWYETFCRLASEFPFYKMDSSLL